ncbi:MAG: metal ABC transporter permease [Planctomycetes bacterium]|nr:metal ABC transporter permease [Planctomycetota bacterium]
MIQAWREFLDSWALFGTAYLTGWFAALLLALLGVLVVARRQVLIGLAIAQASTFGIALAIWLGELLPSVSHHAHHGPPLLASIGAAVVAAWATLGPASRGRVPDAVAAWIWLACSAGAVLLLAHSPHGTEEVETLMFSTLLGADDHDLWMFGVATVAAITVIARNRRALLLTATDRETARALGQPVDWIDRGTAWAVGLAVGSTLHATGTLYTFGCLVLPALAARYLCSRMVQMLWVAPMLALACSFAAFVIANSADLPPAQVAIAAQALVLVVARLVPLLRADVH